MIGAALDTMFRWKMRRVRFPEQADGSAAATTAAIVDVFLAGARTGFRAWDRDGCLAEEGAILPVQRPFFWEGHALGVAARRTFGLGTPYQAPGFRFMLFTGIGFWNGLAGDYGFPAVWPETEDDFLGCRPLIAGGTSFAVTATLGRVDPAVIARLERPEISWWRHGLWQGVGRAAWFLYMNDFQRLARVLEEAGDDAVPLAEGLGLAMTFTQLSRPRTVIAAVEALPVAWQASARAGSRLSLAAVGADDPRVVPTLEALPEPLATWFREGRAALEEAGRGPDMAERLSRGLYDARPHPIPLPQAGEGEGGAPSRALRSGFQ